MQIRTHIYIVIVANLSEFFAFKSQLEAAERGAINVNLNTKLCCRCSRWWCPISLFASVVGCHLVCGTRTRSQNWWASLHLTRITTCDTMKTKWNEWATDREQEITFHRCWAAECQRLSSGRLARIHAFAFIEPKYSVGNHFRIQTIDIRKLFCLHQVMRWYWLV